MKIMGWLFVYCLFPADLIAAELTAADVVSKADKLFRGESSHSVLTMKIIRPDWSRELGMESWSKGDDYALVLITAPARDKGTVFLKRVREMWQWVPSIKRVVKIPPSMMSQSWMGSDFTNDDLVREASAVKDYTHRFLTDTTVGDTTMYRIEMRPRPEAPVVWDKVIQWITKSTFIQRRGEFFDETGRLVNLLKMEGVREMGGRNIPTRLEMMPMDKKSQETLIEYKAIEFDIPIKESFFSLQNMTRVH
jgi:hypothetical protein